MIKKGMKDSSIKKWTAYRAFRQMENRGHGMREDVPRGFTTESVRRTVARKKGEVMARKTQGDFPPDL